MAKQLSHTFSTGDKVIIKSADFAPELVGEKGIALNPTKNLLDNTHSLWVAIPNDITPTRWFYVEEIKHADPMTAYLRSFSGE